MTRRSLAVAAVMALVGGAWFPMTSAAAASTGGDQLVAQARLAAAPPARSTDQGPVAGSTPESMEVVLAPSDPAGLAALVKAVEDPSSSQFHHWLSPRQFADRFGPSARTVAQTLGWLRARGLPAERTSTFTVTAGSDTGHLGRATGTVFHRYRLPSGATGLVARGAPLVPAGLRPQIQALMGLSTLPDLHPESLRVSRSPGQGGLATASFTAGATSCPSATTGAINLDQLTAAYGISSLIAGGLNGSGQTVALYELAQYSPSDVSAYQSCFNLTNSVSRQAVDGGGSVDPNGGTAEADLDIEQVATQSPGAAIQVYDAPNTDQGAYDEWTQIIEGSAARPAVISTSWGACEDDSTSAMSGMQAYGTLFQQAAVQGQTVLAASGDSGSEDCSRDYTTSSAPSYAGNLEVDYPGSDPNVVSVGGTTDDLFNGTEVTWNSCGTTSCASLDGYQAAGGGGESLYEPRPSWQPDVYDWPTAEPCGTKCRQVPDLSANAGYPMEVYAGGAWGAYGGTSFAAPMMAGLLADRNQGCTSGGSVAKTFYDLSRTAGYAAGFRDITSGNNDMLGTHANAYTATTGYDLATGLGTPHAEGLACPEVESLSSTTGAAGDQLTVTGLGLEDATFAFGATAATVLSRSATSAVIQVPSGTGTVAVQASYDGDSGTATTAFTYGSSTTTTTSAPTTTTTTSTPTTTTTTSGGGGSTVTTTTTAPTTTTTPTTSPAPTPIATAPPACPSTAGRPLGSAAGIAAVDLSGCDGYYVADSAGQVSAFGAAVWHGDLSGYRLAAPIIAIQATPDGKGYWMLGADGGVFTFGDARFYGSTGGYRLNAAVVGMAATPDSRGYWIVARDGGVFSFGDARFFGSTGGLRLAAPVDGIAVAPGGSGYWLVASDGGVFTFTSDGFYGSLGRYRLAKPIVGMSSTSDGRGYTLVGSDGGVFSFGDAPFYGSLGSHPPATPVVDLSPVPGNDGYYLVTSGGAVYAFGPGSVYLGSV